ncbi:hypothetical protein TYRP_019291 [Tyrophagus putrescentiae]|nr:hypothetical protein TYRP_019291 [Tyrophagus putrescentiae]
MMVVAIAEDLTLLFDVLCLHCSMSQAVNLQSGGGNHCDLGSSRRSIEKTIHPSNRSSFPSSTSGDIKGRKKCREE